MLRGSAGRFDPKPGFNRWRISILPLQGVGLCARPADPHKDQGPLVVTDYFKGPGRYPRQQRSFGQTSGLSRRARTRGLCRFKARRRPATRASRCGTGSWVPHQGIGEKERPPESETLGKAKAPGSAQTAPGAAWAYCRAPIVQNSVSPEELSTPSLSVTTKPWPAASMVKPSTLSRV